MFSSGFRYVVGVTMRKEMLQNSNLHAGFLWMCLLDICWKTDKILYSSVKRISYTGCCQMFLFKTPADQMQPLSTK